MIICSVMMETCHYLLITSRIARGGPGLYYYASRCTQKLSPAPRSPPAPLL